MTRRHRLRPPGPPSDVRDVPASGERVIAWGRGEVGAPVVVTTAALYVPGPEDPAGRPAFERLPFERIASATWADPVLELQTVGPERRRHMLRLEQPGRVPPAVRERVTASIVVTEHVSFGRGAGARITARRSTGDEPVVWNVVFDPGLDASDPALRKAADEAIERLREATGL